MISHNYQEAGYPKHFIDSVTRQYQNKSDQRNIDGFDDYIIPLNFFDIPKPFILIKLPFCENNEIKSKHSLKKFHHFIKDCFEVDI